MADNVAISAGSGTTIAADEVTDGTLGSCKVQYVKLMDGTIDGTAKALVSANGLAVAATIVGGHPTTMPSTVADGASVTLGAKADAKSAATDTTAVTVMQVLKEISYMEQNPASRAVTNTGTFAVQSTDSLLAVTQIRFKVAFTASQTAATVYTPTSGKKFVLTDLCVSATGAGTVYLFDSTDDSAHAIGPILSLAANGGWSPNCKMPIISAAANNVLKYTSGSGAAGSIWGQGYEV